MTRPNEGGPGGMTSGTPGAVVDVEVERPVAGGWMLGRADGRIVFVSGAVPGERVRARIGRRTGGATFASTVEVLEASPDRRPAGDDAACGGQLYRHIAYPRQLTLKGEVVADAFRRIARLPLERPPAVRASDETGYRLRARLHVRDGLVGFYREGTHEICPAAATGQLSLGALSAVGAVVDLAGPALEHLSAIVLAENATGSARVIHLEPVGPDAVRLPRLDLTTRADLTGLTTADRGRLVELAGIPTVTDRWEDLCASPPPGDGIVWTRHATSFFQGNRSLAGVLVERVLAAVSGDRIVDLYAGVGLFTAPLAARGASVVAVEGDRSAGADLRANTRPWRGRVLVVPESVERAVSRPPDERPDAVVLDPPRTGATPAALRGVIAWRAPLVAYVSCDPPTLARDALRLVDAGYQLDMLEAFDFFPHTPHVETLAVFRLG
ncbi:MAG: hypothetical protein R2752_09455 [Vicinamibacterales bacterium]